FEAWKTPAPDYIVFSGQRSILAVQEANGLHSIDTSFRGSWVVKQASPYRIEVDGSGEIAVRGHRFTWDGERLCRQVDESSRCFNTGDYVVVKSDGSLDVGPPME